MGTQLGFKWHRESHYLAQCSRKLWFRHCYRWMFLEDTLPLWVLEVHINGITGVTINTTEPKIKKFWFDTNVGLVLYLHATPLQPSPISLLRVHLNGIGNVTIHLNASTIYEFFTNVDRLRLCLQNITCTSDLVNGTAQNNMNRMHVFVIKQCSLIGIVIIK